MAQQDSEGMRSLNVRNMIIFVDSLMGEACLEIDQCRVGTPTGVGYLHSPEMPGDSGLASRRLAADNRLMGQARRGASEANCF
jgi:hypothetical protein